MRTHRVIAASAAALLIVASCGGDDDATPADEPADAAEPAAADEPATEPADGDGDEPAAVEEQASGDNTVTVTIEGTTHVVDVSMGPAPRCDPDFFGAMWASGGDADAFVNALLPPPDDPNHDAANITLNVGELEWIADPEKSMSGVEPGESQVDDYTVDGNTASGTATFVELEETYGHSGGGPKATPVTGTFEISCSG